MVSTSTSTDTDADVDTGFLRGPRRDILEAIAINGGRAIASTIAESADRTAKSVRYHLSQLADRGHVDHVDDIETPSGQFAQVWALTDAGEHALDAYDDRGAALVTTTNLEARIESLESQVETLTAQLDEVTDDDEYEI